MEEKMLQKRMLEYRAKHNIPAAEMARRCGVTTPTIYNIENGIQTPSKLTRQKILNVIQKEEVL